MDKPLRIEIKEIFMAKAGNDWSRCFHGTIKRGYDENGSPVVRGKIKVNDGFICAMAGSQDELGEKLDDMVLLILNHNIQSKAGIDAIIAGTPFFLN